MGDIVKNRGDEMLENFKGIFLSHISDSCAYQPNILMITEMCSHEM